MTGRPTTFDEAARDLVEAIALLERAGLVDYNGHASLRLPGGRIAINSGASNRSAIHTDDITIVHADGTAEAGLPAAPHERFLHTALYDARPDIGAVVHGHSPHATTLTIAELSYRPVYAQGALLGEVPLFPAVASISEPGIAREMARVTGGRRAVLLQSHGFVACGTTLAEAVVLALYLEENARRQLSSLSASGRCREMTGPEVAAAEAGLRDPALFAKAYDYFRLKAGLPSRRGQRDADR